MKYIVVAKVWSEEQGKRINRVAGQFERYMDAEIFKNAYNDYYKANAVIVSMDSLVNE